jgi:multidrug efflux pump subunit AcrB
VIAENIDAERENGADDSVAAYRGAKGVLAPIVVGVLTTVAAFAPLLVTGGTFGDITRAIPIVVICVLLVSLLEAFCILPSHRTTAATGRAGQSSAFKVVSQAGRHLCVIEPSNRVSHLRHDGATPQSVLPPHFLFFA